MYSSSAAANGKPCTVAHNTAWDAWEVVVWQGYRHHACPFLDEAVDIIGA